MANLNFQQPPRSLASGSLGGARGPAGAGAAPLLSPGRGAAGNAGAAVPGGGPPTMAGRATLFGQRAFADRRAAVPGAPGAPGAPAAPALPPPLSQAASNALSSNFGGGRAAYGGYHSVFGAGDAGTPPLLDMSEFPSLSGRGDHQAAHAPAHSGPPPGTKPYVGMVKQPTSEQSEFTMSSEDFPALPGTAPGGPAAAGGAAEEGLALAVAGAALHIADLAADPHARTGRTRTGIQTSPDGKVTNTPSSMVQNQFGIVGLLTFIRASEADPDLVSLALGQDLTALGLNLNSPENLHVTFAGPWTDAPCRPQDIDYHVPPEYMINSAIREKLAPIKLNRYKDDLLFYLFYCFVGDYLQLYAAQELYNRDWRFHVDEKVWITQAPGMQMVEKTSTYERGTYYFFDVQNWRKVAKDFHLDYGKLEGRPQAPAHALS